MKEFPGKLLPEWLVRLFRWQSALNIPLHSAYAGYFIVLSLFPALLLVLSSLRYTGLQVADMLEMMREFIPAALMPAAEQLVNSTYRNASGAVAGLAAVTALWSSSQGIYGLLIGLDAVYGVSETRGYFYTRGISVLYTFAFGILFLLILVLHVFGNALMAALHSMDSSFISTVLNLLNLRFVFLLILEILFFTLMYTILPNRHNTIFESFPGGLLAAIGWLLFSNLYSQYVTHFPRYANIYGSVYAIAVSMLWLYFCMSILFYGGALNRLLTSGMGEQRS